MEEARYSGEQFIHSDSQLGLGVDSVRKLFSAWSTSLQTYLFTFWPPGPLDLLNETSPISCGTELGVKFATHFLAEASSSALGADDVD
jgi:hypothetical protein